MYYIDYDSLRKCSLDYEKLFQIMEKQKGFRRPSCTFCLYSFNAAINSLKLSGRNSSRTGKYVDMKAVSFGRKERVSNYFDKIIDFICLYEYTRRVSI